MKTSDRLAMLAGTISGSALADSLEQVVASAAAAIAVYLVRLVGAALLRRLQSPRP